MKSLARFATLTAVLSTQLLPTWVMADDPEYSVAELLMEVGTIAWTEQDGQIVALYADTSTGSLEILLGNDVSDVLKIFEANGALELQPINDPSRTVTVTLNSVTNALDIEYQNSLGTMTGSVALPSGGITIGSGTQSGFQVYGTWCSCPTGDGYTHEKSCKKTDCDQSDFVRCAHRSDGVGVGCANMTVPDDPSCGSGSYCVAPICVGIVGLRFLGSRRRR